MKKIIILFIVSLFFFSCTSIPSGPDNFGPEKIGEVSYYAESLAFHEASYLYIGAGKKNLLMLSEFDAEVYEDAFGVKTKFMASGLYNEYLKINPGIHDITFVSHPQGVSMGNTTTITTIDTSYEFIPGHVYVFDQKESDTIDISFWKIGSDETFIDQLKLSESRF